MPTITFFIGLLLLVLPLGADQEETATFRSGVSSVRIDVQVLQDNELVTDLTAQDFIVYDQDVQQTISYFGRDSEPLTLLLLFDVSGSMSKYVEQVAAVARQSLRFFVRVIRSPTWPLLAHRKSPLISLEIWMQLHEISAKRYEDTLGSATLINEALVAAANHLDAAGNDIGRRAVLILTDNLGLNFRSPDELVVGALNGANAVLNAIVVGRGNRPVHHETAATGIRFYTARCL
ncbi:MAG: VWA domain-containing protein [Bryobacteraceae bacterium]